MNRISSKPQAHLFERDPDQPGKLERILGEEFAADIPVEELESECQDGGGFEVAEGFKPRTFFHALGMERIVPEAIAHDGRCLPGR